MADPTIVKGPEGTIKFPGTMSSDDIQAAMVRMYPPKVNRGPAYDDPTKSGVAQIGAHVPDMAVAPLQWAQRNLVDPFNRLAAKGEYYAKRSTEPIETTPGQGISGLHIAPEGTLEAHHPIAGGIEKGIAGVVGGAAADPRNWPFFASGAARPALQKLISRGFGAQMGVQAVQGAKDLYDNWDKYTPAQRAEIGTQAGLSGAMSAGSFAHTVDAGTIETGKRLATEETGSAGAPSGRNTFEQVFRRGIELKSEGLSEPEQLFHLMKEFPDQSDQIAKAYGYKSSANPKVGGEAPSTQAASPKGQPVQTPGTPPRSGEPVRPAEGSALEQRLQQVAQPARDTTTLKEVQTEHPEWTLSQQLQEAAKRVQPSAEKEVQDTSPGLAPGHPILEARTQEIMRRKPGMAEGTARRMAREQLEGERGSLSFRSVPPTIGPQQAGLVWRAGDAMQGLSDAMGRAFGDLDAVNENERTARILTRGMDSEKKLLALQTEEKLKSTIESHDNDGKTEFRAFMDAGEGKPGSQFLKPADQVTANALHDEFQKRWTKINDILDRDPQAGIDNYLSHIWKRPNQAQAKIEAIIGSKQPLAGQGSFLNKRIYQYASDGLDRGLEPLTMNPVRMQLAALNQIDKFITAHELKDAYKDAGIVQWVKVGGDIPSGYQKLHDKLFEPMLYKEGGLIKYGTYYASPEVARIFNRYLQPGLSGNLAYDTLRNYGNTLNQVNLGVSGYHGSFITVVAGSSDVALGLEKVINNRDVGGINNILRGTVGTFSAPFDIAIQGIADKLGQTKAVENLTGSSSAGRFYKRGREIQKEAISPSPGPKTHEQQVLSNYVQDLVKAGAAFKQDQFYRTPEGQQFFRNLYKNPFKAIQAAAQKFPITKGIMDYYVPRVKLGMASYMMEAKLQELVKNGVYDDAAIQTEMSKIWDSVDNRAGQMKYDNLFWNKSAKDLSFLAVRAVGWDLGTAREIGGAGVDVLSGLGKLAKGEKPSTLLSGRAAFVLGTTITLGTIGATMTYLATGKSPQTLLDYFYPPTGRTGTNGKAERYALPTYAKDVVNFWNKPGSTLIGKLHPSVEQLYEFYNNRDFQDTEIYDRGSPDPLYKKGYDVLSWWAKTATPFAVTTTLARERGSEGAESPVGLALESFGGLQRAGREVSSSKAEDYIFNSAKRYWEAGPVTRADRERRELFFKFREQQRMGKLNDDALGKALDEGKLQDTDFNRIYKDEGLTNTQSEFKFLASHDISSAVKALQLMTPEERTQYRDQTEQMLGSKQMSHLSVDEQNHYMDEVDKLMSAAPQ